MYVFSWCPRATQNCCAQIQRNEEMMCLRSFETSRHGESPDEYERGLNAFADLVFFSALSSSWFRAIIRTFSGSLRPLGYTS